MTDAPTVRRSRKRLLLLAVLLIFIFYIVVVWGFNEIRRSNSRNKSDFIGPEQQTTARTERGNEVNKVSTRTNIEPFSEPFSVHVWLRDIRITRYRHRVAPEPWYHIWPRGLDEGWDHGAFDSMHSDELLLSVSLQGLDWSSPSVIEAIQMAGDEGLLVDPALIVSPERALVALQAQRLKILANHSLEWEQFESQYLREGDRWHTLTSEERAYWMNQHSDLVPLLSFDLLQELCVHILYEWPGHPVTDYARLALIQSQNHGDEKQRDVETMVQNLRKIADPELLEHAALVFTSFTRTALDAKTLDIIESIDMSSPEHDLLIASWGTYQSMLGRNHERAVAWVDRLASAHQTMCDTSNDWMDSLCARVPYQIRDTRSRLAALATGDVETWQEALTAEAWKCHLESPHEGISRTLGTWNGEIWKFGTWDVETSVTRCLSGIQNTSLDPDDPVQVKLTLELTTH